MRVLCQQKGEVGGVQPQGDIEIVAARLGCERAMVGTRWATSHPDYMDRISRGWFLARKVALALRGV